MGIISIRNNKTAGGYSLRLLADTLPAAIGNRASLRAAAALMWQTYRCAQEAELLQRASDLEHRQAVLLQEQIRPHFLFNVLSTLRELCETDPTLAAAGMDNLSGYLRENIDALSERELLPFEQELDYIRHYVALEKLRPSGDFQAYYDLAVLDFAIPALSIQPLVENAIRHGVRGLAGGEVVLSTEQRGDMIRVIVEDNGPGFPRCFGYFELYWQGKPLSFPRKRAKEVLAYLIDRQGLFAPRGRLPPRCGATRLRQGRVCGRLWPACVRFCGRSAWRTC